MSEILIGLHGLGGDTSAWAPLEHAARGRFRVEGIDLPGFGAAASLGAEDVAAMRDYVADKLRGRGPFWLMGQSMGCKIVMAVARLAQDGDEGLKGLEGLILLAGSPPSPEPVKPEAWRAMQEWFEGDQAESRHQAESFVDDNTFTKLPDTTRDAAAAAILRSNRDAWRGWLRSGLKEDWSARIGRIDYRALVVAGGEDGPLGAQGQAEFMLPHLTDERFVVIEGASHLLHLERSGHLADVICDWFAELREPPIPMPADRRNYRALIESPRVSAHSRRVLLERVGTEPASIPPEIEACAIAIAAWCLPGVPAENLVSAAYRGTLDPGTGWRFVVLPPIAAAWDEGVAALDTRAGGRLADLDAKRCCALLDALAEEDPATSTLAAFLSDVQSALVQAYVANPATMARLGYSGPAYGGDTSRLPGYRPVGIGVVEPWEPPSGSVWA